MVVQRTSRCFCTTGGWLQKASSVVSSCVRPPAALRWGPHRPYEGSQPDRDNWVRVGKVVSSSPLRGVATLPLGLRQRVGVEVLIAPTRGRIFSPTVNLTLSPGPHRPYEGSQLLDLDQVHPDLLCPHRPYEGSQRVERGGAAASRHLSSSPLRGVATRAVRRVRLCRAVLIAPTRGRNPTLAGAAMRTSWSSSPLRGVATWPRLPARYGAGPVLIAPTMGRNSGRALAVARMRRPHRPYEGS